MHKVSILDSQLGRIDGISFETRLCLGAIIEYSAQQRNTTCLIANINILDVPLQLARDDLLFLHHVLELCTYFMPVGSNTAGIYDMIVYIYSVNSIPLSRKTKNIFLFKLLALFGAHPEYHVSRSLKLIRLLSVSIDKISKESIDLECEKELQEWLHHSIAEHVNIDCFKTIHYLKQE